MLWVSCDYQNISNSVETTDNIQKQYRWKNNILYCCALITKPPGMQASIFFCMSQARINWEGCARKGIWRENGGDGRDGGTN